jgi:hypothetical protein
MRKLAVLLSCFALVVSLLTAVPAAAFLGLPFLGPKTRDLVPTSQEKPQEWRWTTEGPAATWFLPDFDDTTWKKGPGGFGTQGTPGAVVRTVWDTADIWIRRTVELPELSDKERKSVRLAIHHDEDAEVYINGVQVAKVTGYITGYKTRWMKPDAIKALKPGKNVIAVHCHQTTGGQYIDVGLVLEGE